MKVKCLIILMLNISIAYSQEVHLLFRPKLYDPCRNRAWIKQKTLLWSRIKSYYVL